jgi:ABC-type branched-subunit amino acid transport system substrate-binding protein
MHFGVLGGRGLAGRIHASGARAVYIQAGTGPYMRRLREELDPHVAVISAALAGLPIARLFEVAGEGARGMYVTIPGQPLERLGATGRRFLREFGATRTGARIPNWAVYGAAAAEVLLEAIATSDGKRESVAEALAAVELADSPLGPLRFQPQGELAASPVAVVRADHGGEPVDGLDTAGGVVVDVITPPALLVGG